MYVCVVRDLLSLPCCRHGRVSTHTHMAPKKQGAKVPKIAAPEPPKKGLLAFFKKKEQYDPNKTPTLALGAAPDPPANDLEPVLGCDPDSVKDVVVKDEGALGFFQAYASDEEDDGKAQELEPVKQQKTPAALRVALSRERGFSAAWRDKYSEWLVCDYDMHETNGFLIGAPHAAWYCKVCRWNHEAPQDGLSGFDKAVVGGKCEGVEHGTFNRPDKLNTHAKNSKHQALLRRFNKEESQAAITQMLAPSDELQKVITHTISRADFLLDHLCAPP